MISTTDSGRELTVERTDDGSATLYIAALDEHYHSTKGALAESQHVYIDMCWRHAARGGEDVRVFEVGFGTGLNAALTAEAALVLFRKLRCSIFWQCAKKICIPTGCAMLIQDVRYIVLLFAAELVLLC